MNYKTSFDKSVVLSWRFTKHFLLYFCPAFLVFACMTYFVYTATSQMGSQLIEESEAQKLQLAQDLISDAFLMVHNDLGALSKLSEISEYLSNPGEAEKAAVTELFRTISDVKKIYDQIRLIDATGMEKIRVNYSQHGAVAVPEAALQDKSDRYYFSDIYALTGDQAFISPFDLNIEGGVVEKPIKPMIRFGRPVYDKDGKKQGILVMNYLGQHLLERLDRVRRQTGYYLMLLNSDGYWLKGQYPEDAWGFMFDDRIGDTYQNRFPDNWDQINTYVSGQFYTGAGLITFSSVYPLREITRSNTVGEHRLGWLNGKQYVWKIVSQVDKHEINQTMADTRRSILGLILMIAVCVAVVASQRAYSKLSTGGALQGE